MPYKNKKERIEYCKKWREDNKKKIKEEYQQDKNGIKTKKILRNKKNILFYLEKKLQLKCSRCEENHISCLEFHHLDHNLKEYTISNIIKSSLKKALKEIDKCIVLCSNCHRKEHWDNDKIEKLKANIKKLEIKAQKKKEKKVCKNCKRKENETEFVKNRQWCKDCYKLFQKQKMKERRKITKRVEDNELSIPN